MGLCGCLGGMLKVLQFGSGDRGFGGILEDVLIEIALVVDLIDELVHAGWSVGIAVFERLRAHNLAVVDDKLLVERGYRCQCCTVGGKREYIPYFCISMVSAASVSLTRSSRAATAWGRIVATSSLRDD